MKKFELRIIRQLLAGRISTNIADSMLYMLTIWFFNTHYSSPMLLSMVFALTALVDTLSFLLGPLIDKSNPKQNLYWVSCMQTAVVFAVLILYFIFGSARIGAFMCVSLLVTYIGSAIIYPSGEKLVPYLVPNEKLVSVNSLFTVSEKTTDILFNAISTIIISYCRIDHIFIIMISIFLLASNAHRLVCTYFEDRQLAEEKREIPKSRKEENSGLIVPYITDLIDGICEIKKHPDILMLFLPLSVVNVFYGAAMVGLPVVAELYISDKAVGYGSLLLFSSIGGVLGAGLIRKFPHCINAPRKYTAIFLGISGVTWLLIPISMQYCYLLCFLLIFLSNCTINMMNVMFVALIQCQIEESILGRVTTFTESMASCMIPLGNLLGGWFLTTFNPLTSQSVYGMALLLSSICYFSAKKSSK